MTNVNNESLRHFCNFHPLIAILTISRQQIQAQKFSNVKRKIVKKNNNNTEEGGQNFLVV